MAGVERPRRELAGCEERNERIELVEQILGYENPLMLLLLLKCAEEEHLVLEDRTAERSAILLPAERRLRAVALAREVVLRRELPVALVAECRAVELIGARLGDERDGRAARTSVGRRELVRRELERLQALGRDAHQRAAVMVVAVVGAVDRGLDVAARRSAI